MRAEIDAKHTLHEVVSRRSTLWVNPNRRPEAVGFENKAKFVSAIQLADARLRRFAPLLVSLFPELSTSNGEIESTLIPINNMQRFCSSDVDAGAWYVKADHSLPVAGSIKARGGVHEVLEFAEHLVLQNGIDFSGDYLLLNSSRVKELFSKYTIAVGSTGNLGLSIGIMASRMGFSAVVHMSSDAKQWKKERLRKAGVTVIEHTGDYEVAVAAGRKEAESDKLTYFVDDEQSISLFAGYGVSAFRLKRQLDEIGLAVDESSPLFVYLPCGVGGAPAGIAFGLHLVFGEHVHCFFGEPLSSPCFLAKMLFPEKPSISVYDLGLDNRTDADGLAVPCASNLAIEAVHDLVSGVYTVGDESLYHYLCKLYKLEGLKIEPSAAAGFAGPTLLLDSDQGKAYLRQHDLAHTLHNANHIIWTTGGRYVPELEFQKFLKHGHGCLA